MNAATRPEATLTVEDLGRDQRSRFSVRCRAANGELIGHFGNLYNDRRDVRRAVELMADACEQWLKEHPVADKVITIPADDNSPRGERPSDVCECCWDGDHSHHRPNLGGICIGCSCEKRPAGGES